MAAHIRISEKLHQRVMSLKRLSDHTTGEFSSVARILDFKINLAGDLEEQLKAALIKNHINDGVTERSAGNKARKSISEIRNRVYLKTVSDGLSPLIKKMECDK